MSRQVDTIGMEAIMASHEDANQIAGICFVAFFVLVLCFGSFQWGRTKGYEEGARYVLEAME